MDDALRMNENLYLVGLDTEEPLGLDDLKAFVHHRRGVDGDLGPHVPSGMAQGVSLGDGLQLFHGEIAEGPAGGREQNLFDGVVVFTDETLENGRVLAVDG